MAKNIIYEIQQDGTLMWFSHLGQENGQFKWEGPRKVGTGWGEPIQAFAAGDGIVYAVTPFAQPAVQVAGTSAHSSGGDLMWFRHLGREDGSFRWEGPKKVGTGWGEMTHVFSGGDGIIYGITPTVQAGVHADGTVLAASGGELVWFRHLGREDGSFRWEGPKQVGTGWGEMTQVLSGGDGTIYGITPTVQPGVQIEGTTPRPSGGDLMWFRHLGREDGSARWEGPKKVGTGWGEMTQVFSGDDGIIYGITPIVQPGVQIEGTTPRASGGDLMWFHHLGWEDGSVRWDGPKKVGTGWGEAKRVFSAGDNASLARLAAQNAMTMAWNQLGGARSFLGLPVGSQIETVKVADGFRSQFRSGDLHLLTDGGIARSEEHDEVSISLVGIECQIRQEAVDEIYGVVSVIGAAGGNFGVKRFPESGTIDLGPDGLRISNVNLPLLTNGTVQNYVIVATLFENDSGDVDVIAKKVSDKISSTVAAGVGALTGAPAESVSDSESFKEGLVTGLAFVFGDILGMGDDPYSAETLRLDWAALQADSPRPFQPPVRRDDDPRTIEGWTHRITLSGIDDGGDRGQYALYFRVDVERVRRVVDTHVAA